GHDLRGRAPHPRAVSARGSIPGSRSGEGATLPPASGRGALSHGQVAASARGGTGPPPVRILPAASGLHIATPRNRPRSGAEASRPHEPAEPVLGLRRV